mgnify:CR=1 FL=1
MTCPAQAVQEELMGIPYYTAPKTKIRTRKWDILDKINFPEQWSFFCFDAKELALRREGDCK